MLREEVIYHNTDVGGDELALVIAIGFFAGFAADLARLDVEVQTSNIPLLGRTVAFGYIIACLDGRDGGSVGRWTPDAKFLHLLDERSFSVALWMQGVTLHSISRVKVKLLTVSKCWKAAFAFVFTLALFVITFNIYLQETIELDDLTIGYELQFILSCYLDFNLSLLDDGI